MRRALALAPVLLLVLALGGCGGPPTDFYALAPVAATGGDGPAACAGSTPLVVDHVLLPGILDRQSMVTAAAGDRLAISGQDRWAAPLDQMIQRVLTEDLRDRLGPGRVLAPGDPTPAGGADGVQVNVLRFMPDEAGRVTLHADWTLFGAHGKPLLTRLESLSDAGPATAGDNAAAMSRALGKLADAIAAGLPAAGGCG